MQKLLVTCLSFFLLFGQLFAQQLLPAPFKLLPEEQINLNEISGLALNKPVTCNRQSIIDDFKTVYIPTEINTAQLAWTGSVATCTPGTTSELAKTNTLTRVNYFRKLVGLSNSVVLDQPAYEANCQAAALIMDANDDLSHSPPNNWTCWSQAGSNGAGSSNLALGAHSSSAITLYMYDPGTGNEPAGHRRWILHSRATKFGTGSTSSSAANALFVFGPTAVPPSMPSFIAYPCEGYFPRSLMPTRWSFGIPGANFSNATVSVKNEAGAAVGITQHPYQTGYGDNTLTWEMPNSTLVFTNKEDAIYTVTVAGIANAPAASYTYQVVLIHEETPTVAFTKADPTCENNGAVSATYSAGALSYAWSNGQSGAALSNLLPGTYTVTVTDKVNCTTVATVNLLDNSSAVVAPGNASSSTVVNCEGDIALNLSTTGATNLGPNQIVGWWITQGAPASSTATDQSSLNAAFASATINPASVTPALSSFMYKSINGGHLNKNFNCGGQLDPNKTYYATPFVSQNDSPAPNAYANNTTLGNIVIKDVNAGVPGETEIPINVWQTPKTANLKKVCIQLTYGGFSTLNDLSIKIVDPYGTEVPLTSFFPGSANGNGGFNACYVDDMSGVSTWDGCNGACYTGLINSEQPFTPFSNIDPNGTWTLVVTDDFNQGFKPNYIGASLEFDEAPYSIHFPGVDYSNCVMGEPVEFSCATSSAPAPPTITGQTQFCGVVSGVITAEAGFQSYQWNTGQTTASIQIQQPGTYSVTVSNTFGCTSSNSTIVQVGNAPSTSISGNTQFCQGQSTSLDAGAGFTTYAWSNGQTTRNITVQTSGTYTVTISNASGCSNTASLSVTSINVASPLISGALNFCPGGSTTLNAPAGFAAYVWSTTQTTSGIQVQQAGSYQLTVTNNQGCTATNAVMVTQLPAPTVNISGVQSFCEGANSALNAGAGFTTYSWSNGQITQSITVTTAGTYTVTVVNAQGCTGTDTQDITVHPKPSASISGVLSFCAGQTTELTANAGLSAYAWSTGATVASITVSNAGTYSATVTSSFGCTDDVSVNVSVLPNPVVNLGPDKTIIQGQQTVLNAFGPGLTYVWSTGATTSSITVQTMGTYTVTVTDASGCSGTDEVVVNVTSDAFEPDAAYKIELFPNPASDFIQFRCLGLDVSGFILEDVQGKILLNSQQLITKDNWQKLDLGHLPSGTYFLVLNGEQFTRTVKFVKG